MFTSYVVGGQMNLLKQRRSVKPHRLNFLIICTQKKVMKHELTSPAFYRNFKKVKLEMMMFND